MLTKMGLANRDHPHAGLALAGAAPSRLPSAAAGRSGRGRAGPPVGAGGRDVQALPLQPLGNLC